MSTNVQVKVSIEDQNKKKIKDGDYKAIQIDFSPQNPAKANIKYGGSSKLIPKQRLQITFPDKGTFKIKGNNFGEQPEDNSPNVFRTNANTITVENASDSNNIKEVSVLPEANEPWETLTLDNLSQVVISNLEKPLDGPTPDTEGKLLWSSDVWNRNKRTIKGTDPEDDKLQVRAGGGYRKFEIDGKGTGTLTGHQVRLYINAHCYNVEMQVTYIHKEDLKIFHLE